MGNSQIQDNKNPVFLTKRRTPNARVKSWIGSISLILAALLFAGPYIYILFGLLLYKGNAGSYEDYVERSRKAYTIASLYKNHLGLVLTIQFVIPIVLIIVAVVFYSMSHAAEAGTLTFYNKRIVHSCYNEEIVFLPGQISSVQQNGNWVSIFFLGKTLKLKAKKAEEITHNINLFIQRYGYNEAGKRFQNAAPNSSTNVEPNSPSTSSVVNEKAAAIRAYKKLVDDGVLTREQFEEIVKKMV